jgi:hypothetical protein
MPAEFRVRKMELVAPGSDPSVPLDYDPNAIYNGEWVRSADGLVGQSYTYFPDATPDLDPLLGADPQPEPVPGSDPSAPLLFDPNSIYNGEWVLNSDGLVGQAFTVLPGTTSDVPDPYEFLVSEPEPVPIWASNEALGRFLASFGF